MSAAPHPRDQVAMEILRQNDRGGYSVPTAGLYPFQWNWDSAFAAMGYQHLDPARAVVELETLAGAQWADGMIPHIIFHAPDAGYFPGPEVWQSGQTPPSSGISQPPVFAIALEALWRAGHLSAERCGPLMAAAARWHRWFFLTRRDPITGAIGIVHPWESGQDNMPGWDGALEVVPCDQVAPFVRRDLGHVDAQMRPTELQYKRYIALVEFGRNLGWDQRAFAETSPFFVADPLMTSVLIRAEQSLARLSDAAGEAELASAARVREAALIKGLSALWSERAGGPVTFDVRAGQPGTHLSSGSFVALSPGLLPDAQAQRLSAEFDRIAERCAFMVPSYDPAAPGFDERRYWRGPVWLVVNWLIGTGLAQRGDIARAERVRRDSRRLVEQSGFYEYFSPLDGAGLGGDAFTWSAAAWLDYVRGE
ncbi:MAG: hypothetical protein AAGJ94_03075 [Pseudomonadota bacterium]